MPDFMDQFHKTDFYWYHRVNHSHRFGKPSAELTRSVDTTGWPEYAVTAHRASLAELNGEHEAASAYHDLAEAQMIKECGGLARKWAANRG